MAIKTISPTPTALEDQPDGVRVACDLLTALEALPEVLRAGCTAGEDDAMQFDHDSAARLVMDAMHSAPREQFARALALYLVHAVNGLSDAPQHQWFLDNLEQDEVSHG